MQKEVEDDFWVLGLNKWKDKDKVVSCQELRWRGL